MAGDTFTFLDGILQGPAGPAGPAGAGVNMPVNPTDDGKFAAAQSGDLVYIDAATATSRLNTFTSSLKGLVPSSGGGTANYLRADGTWAAPFPAPANPGDNGKLAYANAGTIAWTPNITTDGTHLLYGSGQATIGRHREVKNPGVFVGYVAHDGVTSKSALSITGDGSTFTDIQVGDPDPTTGNNFLYLQSKSTLVGRIANWNAWTATTGGVSILQEAVTSGTPASAPVAFQVTGGAHTVVQASTEPRDVNFAFDRTLLLATGDFNAARVMRARAPTYTFAAPSTVGLAAMLAINGPPVAGTNATFTNSVAVQIDSGAIGFGFAPTSPTQITFAQSGLLRFAKSPGGIINYLAHDGTTTKNALSAIGDGSTFTDITVGDGDVSTGNAHLNLAAKTQVALKFGGVAEYTFDVSQLTFNGNSSVGANFYSTSGTVAASGLFRVSNNSTVIAAKNNAGTADVPLLVWGSATDRLWLGDSAGAAGVNVLVKTGGDFTINVNGTPEYVFDASQMNWEGNNSVGAGFYSGTGSVAASGLLRGANATTLVAARNAAGTADVVALTVDASNVVVLGGAGTPNAARVWANATTNFTAAINGTDEYVFSSTTLNMNGNSMTSALFVSASGTVAGSGFLRMPSASTIVVARNAANTADITLLSSDASDHLVLGGTGVTASFNNVATGGSQNLQVNSVTEYTFDATALTMNNNNLVMGTGFASFGSNVAGQGSIRFPASAGTNGVWFRNNANSADVSGIFSGTDDVLYLGDSTNSAGVNLRAKASGFTQIMFNGVSSYTFDANKLFIANSGTVPTTDPSGGGYFYSEAGAGKWRGSSGTVTTFGPAEPHCPRCDRDFAHEWESEKYGKLSVCMSCLVDALIASGIPANDFIIERKVA